MPNKFIIHRLSFIIVLSTFFLPEAFAKYPNYFGIYLFYPPILRISESFYEFHKAFDLKCLVNVFVKPIIRVNPKLLPPRFGSYAATLKVRA